MANEEIERITSDSGLGLGQLAMNEIAPSKTEEPSEVVRRSSMKWLWVVVVLAVVGVGAWFFRSALNLPPPAEVQQQFEAQPIVATAMQRGVLHRATFLSGSKMRLDFSPNIATASDEQRSSLRKLTNQLMEALITVRPGRDLELVGFQGDHEMLRAQYQSRSTLVTQEGQASHDIVIHIENDPGGGITSGMRGQGVTGQ